MKTKILFLCTGNSCRSQMAEGWARHLKADTIIPCSAGTRPQGINPRAISVMKEAGVDISRQRSNHVRDFIETPPDIVITLCDHARETCPLFPGNTRVFHRGFEDPAALEPERKKETEILDSFRRVRDRIRSFVEGLPESLPRTDNKKGESP